MNQRIRVLQELGEEFERAVAPPNPRGRGLRLGVGGLGAAFSVIVAIGVAVLAVVLLGHARNAASPPAAPKPRTSTSAAGGLVGRRQGATVTLPRGRATRRFRIQAVAGHAYNVTVNAPASADLRIHMNTPGETRFVLYANTLHGPFCRAHAGRIGCLLPFAAGGVQGGRWTVVITKTSAPPAAVTVSVVFIH